MYGGHFATILYEGYCSGDVCAGQGAGGVYKVHSPGVYWRLSSGDYKGTLYWHCLWEGTPGDDGGLYWCFFYEV